MKWKARVPASELVTQLVRLQIVARGEFGCGCSIARRVSVEEPIVWENSCWLFGSRSLHDRAERNLSRNAYDTCMIAVAAPAQLEGFVQEKKGMMPRTLVQ